MNLGDFGCPGDEDRKKSYFRKEQKPMQFPLPPSSTQGGPGHHTLTDEELCQAFLRDRDNELIGILFKRYLHLVVGVCFNYLKDEEEANDAAMQIFEQLLSKPPEKELRSFKNWLFIITKNHCLMTLRHKQAGQRVMTEKLHALESGVMESDPVMHLYDAEEQEQRLLRLRVALARLPDEQRQCIEMFYYEEKSYQEISHFTGYDLNKVKSHLQNGKRNLKIMLDHGKE